jgi:hypothetical protein
MLAWNMVTSLIKVDIGNVQRMLREAPREIVGSAFVKALSAAGNVIADAVETAAPMKSEDVGGILDRGELREAVSVRVQLDSQLRGGTSEVFFKGPASAVALWLDSGHKIVGHRPGLKQLGEWAGNGFMRKAFDVSADKAIEAFTESLMASLES